MIIVVNGLRAGSERTSKARWTSANLSRAISSCWPFCEIMIFLLSLKKQPNAAPNLFQKRGQNMASMILHPVSITRFPLTRFSPGAGLLRNPFFHRQRLRFSRGWVRKDGNLLTETGCTCLRPVHLLRVFLLRVLESNFPGDSLYNSTDMRIPTPQK